MITHDEHGIARDFLIDGKNAGRRCTGYSVQHFTGDIPSLELFVEEELVEKYPCGSLGFEAAVCDLETSSGEDVDRERT